MRDNVKRSPLCPKAGSHSTLRARETPLCGSRGLTQDPRCKVPKHLRVQAPCYSCICRRLEVTAGEPRHGFRSGGSSLLFLISRLSDFWFPHTAHTITAKGWRFKGL